LISFCGFVWSVLLCALSLHRGAFDREGGLVSGCDAANLRIEISAGAVSGCGFSLSSPREGRNCRPKGMRTGEF